MVEIVCPDCGYKIDLIDPELKDRFSCSNCWADLQVVNLNPIAVAWFEAPEFEDDWDLDTDETED